MTYVRMWQHTFAGDVSVSLCVESSSTKLSHVVSVAFTALRWCKGYRSYSNFALRTNPLILRKNENVEATFSNFASL